MQKVRNATANDAKAKKCETNEWMQKVRHASEMQSLGNAKLRDAKAKKRTTNATTQKCKAKKCTS